MSPEWDCDAFRPPHLIFFPLTDMSTVIPSRWVIMDKC